MNKDLFKSILSVLAGFISVAVLSVLTDMIIEKTGVFPPQNNFMSYAQWMLGFALFYRCIYTVVGGYITASLAPSNKMRHVIILAVIGTILAILGTVANWNKTMGPTQWYPIALVILSFLSVILGGKLKIKSLK